jgi:hypothetical protein
VSPARIPDRLRAKVAEEAGHRCGYCLSPQQLIPFVLEIDHLIPTARGGSDEGDNLWLACHACNLHKGEQIEGLDPETEQFVPLFNPRRQKWSEHFGWSEDGVEVIGRTACGRATVNALQMNREVAVVVRRNWVAAGWHPPQQVD